MMPAMKRATTSPLECEESIDSGSSPSSLGSWPLMQKRSHWTVTKETHSPTTSSSVSSVASSHFSSHSSTLPSSPRATASRTPSVNRPSIHTQVHANGPHRKRETPFRGTTCCSTAKVLIAAKPVMWPSRVAKHWRFTSMAHISSSARSLPPPTAPEMTASAICRMANHAIKWQQATRSSNSFDAPVRKKCSRRPLNAWKSSTAEKMEIVALMTFHEYLRSSGSFRFVR
mmetsp:Transcript_64716/g.189756  ORF Transcript_64716/g.189756 Transcript_64716/m.189756 type:complete len:229 (-) Transcript_64716:254-940(-)